MAESYQKPTVENDEESKRDEDSGAQDSGSKPSNASGRKPVEKQVIILKDATGRKLTFPYAICKTWHGMEELIEQAMLHVEFIGDHVKQGHFDLLGPDGSVILPSVWEQFVEPGWFVTMRMWKDVDEAKKKEQEAAKRREIETAKLEAEELRKQKLGKDKAPIRFKDAVGRKFTFPFHLCQTWPGMEELIKQAFLHVDVIGPHVQAGHYDLLGPDGEIILPQIWEKVIEPDWAITMLMWPMDRPRPPAQAASGRPPGASNFPWGAPAGRGTMPRPMPPPQPMPPPPPPPGVIQFESADDDLHRKSGKATDFTDFIFGKRKKIQSKSDQNGAGDKIAQGTGLPLTFPPARYQQISKPKTRIPASPSTSPLDLQVGRKKSKKKAKRSPSTSTRSTSSTTTRASRSEKSSYFTSDDSGSENTEDRALSLRKEAKQRDLIVVCKPRGKGSLKLQPRTVRQQTLTTKGVVPSSRLDIDAARVYRQVPSTVTLPALELVLLPKAPQSAEQKMNQNILTQMRWIHVTKPSMNLQELEYIALDQLCSDADSRYVVSYLIDTLRYKRRNDDWSIKPGTILRCDTAISDKTFESACFVSIPTLHASPSDASAIDNNPETCRERKLHEAFDQANGDLDEYSNWPFKTGAGGGETHKFWVRQSWLLITKSGVLTYSSHPRDVLEGNNITIHDDIERGDVGEHVIQIMDENRRLFYISSTKCKSFYELEIAVRSELIRSGVEDVDESHLQFLLPNDQPLTAAKWTSLLKLTDVPCIRVLLSNPSQLSNSDESEVSSLSDSVTSGDSDSDSSLSDGPSLHSTRSVRTQRSDSSKTKSDEQGFILLSSEPTLASPDLDIPDLNKRVPPFLSWLSRAESGNGRNVNKGFKEGVVRTESKLARAENRAFDESLMEDLYHALGDTDVYSEAGMLSFDEFEQDRRGLYKSKSRLGSVSVSSLSTEVLNTVEEYFDVSLRVLESFVSPQFRSTLVGKYLAALSMIMKDPTQGLRMRETDLHEDPELSDTPDQLSNTRWVISRTRIQEDGLKYRGPSANDLQCNDCDRGIVYDSLELAMIHLRGRHVLGSAPEDRLRFYAIPEASAFLERRREDQHELLQNSRNAMAAVLQKLVYIQDGVTYDDEFREQRGLPHQLIDSLRWIVVYICAVPHIFHQISWFYGDDLPNKAAKHLASSKIRRQMNLLSKVGLEAEDQVRKAERALISPTSFSSEHGPESFLVSVGPHYLVTQIVGNLLRMPVLNQKHASDVYNAYTSNLRSQVLRRPSKRQVLKIGALNDDLDLIRKFYEWQRETVRSFDLIASPATYSKKAEFYGERERLFAMEYEILLGQDARLEKNMQQINKMIDLCDWMVEQIRQRTEIMKDDQSQVIFIFTTVTVVFLPLSFVASYVSMGSDATELDWRGLQVLFWTVAGPLTVVVIIFCLMAAKRRTLLQIILATQWTGRALEWKKKTLERATYAWSQMGARLPWRKKIGEDEDDAELTN